MSADLGFNPEDWNAKIENARLTDIDGDLSYTIHINKAKQICAELENHYLKICKKLLDKIDSNAT